MVRRHLLVVVLAVAGCRSATTATPLAPSPSSTRAAALGETLALDSKLLGERRVINVYVPPDYATSQVRYPVLYMLDGGMGELDVSI